MIWLGKDRFKFQKNEPHLRSCQECNSGHKYLHDSNDGFVFCCFACGRYWLFGTYADTIKDWPKFMKKHGVEIGASTWNPKKKVKQEKHNS